MDIAKIQRVPWDHFPDVLIVGDESRVKSHPAYESAKTGDAGSAKILSAAFVSPRILQKIQELGAGRKPVLVPVHAIEDRGINRIPAAFAELLAGLMDLEVADNIIQANVVSHTGATGWERMARPPAFDGQVPAGTDCLLIDDFVGQGGTLANLRSFLIHGGAKAIGAITLTGKDYSAKLALNSATLDLLRHKHGPEIEIWWRQIFDYGFECLTESEARYLLRAEDAHTIRARILAARS